MRVVPYTPETEMRSQQRHQTFSPSGQEFHTTIWAPDNLILKEFININKNLSVAENLEVTEKKDEDEGGDELI